MIVIGWILGILIYLIISNLIIQKLLDILLLEIKDTDKHTEGFFIFILGMFIPIVLLYLFVNEISIYLYNLINHGRE